MVQSVRENENETRVSDYEYSEIVFLYNWEVVVSC